MTAATQVPSILEQLRDKGITFKNYSARERTTTYVKLADVEQLINEGALPNHLGFSYCDQCQNWTRSRSYCRRNQQPTQPTDWCIRRQHP